jgi:hypothetical protein
MRSTKSFAAVGAGVFLLSAANLMLELVLTRIFSVVMWYHFAFMSISLALLGASIAGILIYLMPRRFRLEQMGKQLTLFATLFAVSAVLALVVQLRVHVTPELSIRKILPLGLIYIPALLPFFFGGMAISLALTHLTRAVSKLYFLDLVGAGLGCLIVIPVLDQVSGPTAILVVAALAALSALAFSLQESRVYRGVATGMFVLALVGVGINARSDMLRVEFAKGQAEDVKLFEKWNHFSRIAVFGDREAPFLWMNIDALAGTPIPRFHGTPDRVEYNRQDAMAVGYEIAYLAYHLRDGGRALIIGPGGGLDVVAALAFGQQEVTAVEINPVIIDAVNNHFADYTSSLYALPRVRTVIDEGRSYVAGSGERYDVIQASMTDTWAATGAGAFSLSENYLYTEEAFADYYRHLTDEGILTITRWYFESLPAEMFRLVGLAQSALGQVGVSDTGQHIVVAAHNRPEGFGVLMLKKTPFTASEIAALESLAPGLDMNILYAPGLQADSKFYDLITADDPAAFYASYPLNITPPTDNNPFFFHLLRPSDFLSADSELLNQGAMNMNLTAVSVLINLLILISILAALFIFGPLLVARRRDLGGRGSRAMLLVYFAGLGLGFMTIEISLMQRFILFLGHPIYSLTVILFSLLFFAGLGSLTTNTIKGSSGRRVAWIVLALTVLLSLYVFALPGILHSALDWAKTWKVILSIALLAPLGYLMGMPFPLGMKLADATAPRMVPWLWGINGTLSVLASVLSVFLALNLGFTFVTLVGQAAYAVAFAAVLLGSRRQVAGKRLEERGKPVI